MRTNPVPTVAAAVIGLLLTACGSATGGAESGASPAASSTAAGTSTAAATSTGSAATAPADGAYLPKAEYQDQMASRAGTKVVYFFHASWCPTCRATEAAIARDGIPAGLTVVKVDFDTETDLRKEYGVTTQHTFVQVGPDGGELAKWTGSVSGADIEDKTV